MKRAVTAVVAGIYLIGVVCVFGHAANRVWGSCAHHELLQNRNMCSTGAITLSAIAWPLYLSTVLWERPT